MRINQAILVAAILAASLPAQSNTGEKSKSSKTAAPKAAVKNVAPKPARAVARNNEPATKRNEPVTIPKDAKEIYPGTFRHVDAKGQAWLYTQTPFGIMRGPESATATQPEPVPTDWKVTDLGDNLEFERPWPFGGPKKWTKSKSDLTETEAAVWKRHQELSGRKQ